MTSQNMSRLWLLVFLIGPACGGGSRHNDSSETLHSLASNNTHHSVSYDVTSEEVALNSDPKGKATQTPLEEEAYDNYNPPEDTAPLEEDMLNAERNRESGYVGYNSDRLPFQESTDDLEKQINATLQNRQRHYEEGIVDAEIDRDGTLSDMSQAKSNNQEKREVLYGSGPRFEFLIGSPIENFTGQALVGKDGVENHTRKPFVPPKSAWPVPQAQFLTAEPKLNHTTGLPDAETKVQKVKPNEGKHVEAVGSGGAEDYVELVEVVKHGDNANKSAVTYLPHANATGFFLDNDAPDTIFALFAGFTDLQTLFLACFATLVPLLIALFLACGLRFIWRRYRRDRRGTGYQGGLRGGSADPLPDKKPHSPATELKAAESGYSGGNDANEETGDGREDQPSQPPANGSIITMTLKNNHLIVETEVRNDIAHGARETKMKYSANNDGVFVVEVQQSNEKFRRSPQQRVQVHRSPLPIHGSTEGEEETNFIESDSGSKNRPIANSNTGLSTSDLSLSSTSSHNPSYSYGNQVGYEQGHYGYPVYTGYVLPPKSRIPYESSCEPLVTKTPTDPDKPVITAAIFKQDSIIAGDEIVKPPVYSIEGSTDGPLLSDIQAREVSLHKLQDKIEHQTRVIANIDSVPSSDTEEDRYQEQQRQLGNGVAKKEQTVVEINHDKSNQCLHRADSLPPRLKDECKKQNNVDEDDFDTIEEENSSDCFPGDIASGSPLLGSRMPTGMKGKRASLPIITPDLYTTLKETTKNILPNLSPKFEKFNNENSPMESNGEKPNIGPPLITVTEEAENIFNSTEDVAAS